MFYNAVSFNQPLASWDVSNVKNMYSMFAYAISFDQSLLNWDTSDANIASMLLGASSFNQENLADRRALFPVRRW